MKVTYDAAICGVPGNYGVVFPDFIGCVSAGDTLDEATAMAHEALQLHVEGMLSDNDAMPAPRRYALEEVARMFDDPDDPIDETWLKIVPVEIDTEGSADRVAVSLKADLVRRIVEDSRVTALRLSTGQFIEDAVEHELERYRKRA